MNARLIARRLLTPLSAGLLAASMISCTYPYAGPHQQVGTVVGAGAGALAGAIIGNQSGRGLEGAAIGTALGAVAGAAVGNAQDQVYYRQPQPVFVQPQPVYYTQPAPVIVQRRVISTGFGWGGGWGNNCGPWGRGASFGTFGNCYNPCW